MQERSLQAAKSRYKREKADYKAITLQPGKKLTGAERRRLTGAVRKARRDGRIPISAQETIPYRQMHRNGICDVDGHFFTKQIEFLDINYQLAQPDDKIAIFENWCDFLNYFDSSIRFQLSFLNQRSDMEAVRKSINIPEQADAHNGIRQEYAEMLRNQLARGNNGLVKTKYITFGVEAENMKAARTRLERIEADILANFKVLGVRARALNGYERLAILHQMFHPAGERKFSFSWDAIWQTGLSTKDFIAPDSFTFQGRYYKIGQTYGAASFIQILASELTDRMLADLLDLENSGVVTLHIRSIDQSEAIKEIKRKITDIDKTKIEEQKKAVRAGYDMDIIPSDLATYGNEAKTLLEDLQNRNERMFLVTVIVNCMDKNRQKLENSVFQAAGIAQKYNCILRRLDYQQEQGFLSSLPIGVNQVEIERGLTTSSTAIFVPFTTQELFQDGEALYYGVNALSNNLIMCDRKKLKNPNGLILGTPGAGKSFAAKREITNAFLVTEDDIVIVDPEAEYAPLVSALGGQIIKVSPVSEQYVNPMDINLNYSEDDDPLILKSDFILSLMELMMGKVEADEKSIIDQCLRRVYHRFFENPVPEKMPILQDLYEEIQKYGGDRARHIADCMAIYVTGSLNVFNHRTNVDIHSRIVCYDIKELGKQLKKLGMLVVQDQVWGRVTVNREAHKSTRLYIDEFHLLLKEEQTAAYSVEIWKRFRKWGGLPSGITQNVKDLLASQEIENIFENSDFIYMLNQAAGDRKILAKQLNISPHQLSYVTNANAGEGLIFYGNVIIPFADHFPTDTKLYGLLTTRPEDKKMQQSAAV